MQFAKGVGKDVGPDLMRFDDCAADDGAPRLAMSAIGRTFALEWREMASRAACDGARRISRQAKEGGALG
jgi:hypothetical protein